MRIIIFLAILFLSLNIYSKATPKIYNFRVENSNKNRVYFDVDGDITGLTTQGFVISGKTITGVNTTGNYFTVSSPFTFWDNNTIRLGENNDKTHKQSVLFNFTLTYINNNIPEPVNIGTEYFVDGSVSRSGDGLSEANAFKTIQEGIDVSGAGDKVWIKAFNGTYAAGVSVGKKGKINNPTIYEGYKTSTGGVPVSITSNYYIPYSDANDTTSAALDTNEMPTLDNGNRNSAMGWLITGEGNHNIIIRNIQMQNMSTGIGHLTGYNRNNIILERINIKDLGSVDGNNNGNAFAFRGPAFDYRLRFKDCIAVNGAHSNFAIKGQFNLLDNCKSYSDELGTGKQSLETDYYMWVYGKDNININSLADRRHSQGFGGHGFNIKYASDHNLVENCEAINIAGAYVARHDVSVHNVFRGNISRANVSYRRLTGYQPAGCAATYGASYNVYENNYIHDVAKAIGMAGGTEPGYDTSAGIGNIFRNNIIVNVTDVISIDVEQRTSKNPLNKGNKIYNNTILNATNLFKFREKKHAITLTNNEFKNNIVINVTNFYNKNYSKINGYDLDHNNFFGGMTPQGSNYTSDNPKLNTSYRLSNTTPLSVSEGGKELPLVRFGKDGVERSDPYSLGAFQKKNDNKTGSVNANAGSDQTICQGESVTLTASGGSSYSWNTGATTKSITVNPNTTTTYTVTVTEGNESDSDNVEVTVNSVTANAGSNKTINEGENITLTASGGSGYSWNTGATTKSITVNPSDTTTYSVTVTNNGCEDTDEVIVTVNPNNNSSVSANAGSDQTICQGESVTLTASGGSSYSWNTGATTKSITVNPNTTTTYTVTVTEGNESDSDNVEVTVNSVTANAGSNKTINEGENITLTASGGSGYSWNTGATTKSITVNPSDTTTYSVTVTNNGCEDTDEVIVTVNPNNNSSVSANAGSDQTICQGESVTLTASGGSSYSWNTGATTKSITVNPNTTTTYTVTVTEGSESDSDNVEVIVNSVTANAGSNKTMNEGENITLTASGGGTYLWDTGAKTRSITVSPQETRNYSVTVYKNDCQDTDIVQVTVIENDTSPPPAKADAGEDVTICLGESVKLNATGGSTYLWSTGETLKTINVNPTRTTTYTLTATRGGITNSDTVVVTVENCSVSNVISSNEFTVYPNPSNGILNIKIKNDYDTLNLNIYNINGSIVYKSDIKETNNELFKTVDLSSLTKGIYIVRVYNSNYSKTKKVLLF